NFSLIRLYSPKERSGVLCRLGDLKRRRGGGSESEPEAAHMTDGETRENGLCAARPPFHLRKLRDFAQWRRQSPALRRDRNGYDLPALFRKVPAYCAAEIFIERIESVGLEFAKYLAELLLDSVHRVEEIAPVHIEAPAAELPIRAQKVMKLEDPVFLFVQHPPAYKTKIGNIFFVLPPPCHTPVFAADLFQTNRADVLLFQDALPEPGIACLKDSSQNAVAG